MAGAIINERKGVGCGLVNEDGAEYDLFTDQKGMVIVTDGLRVGVARLSENDDFDLVRGAQIALMRLELSPEDVKDYRPFIRMCLNGRTQSVRFNRSMLSGAAKRAMKELGWREANGEPPGIWRLAEAYSREVAITLVSCQQEQPYTHTPLDTKLFQWYDPVCQPDWPG